FRSAEEGAADGGGYLLVTCVELRTAAVPAELVVTRSGFAWRPDCALEDATDNVIIYLPGLWRNPLPLIRRNGYLFEWLRDQYQNGALISAVGTGCCFLAEAGLLDG